MDFQELSQAMESMGIRLGVGPKGGCTLQVPCRRAGSENVSRRTIAAVMFEGDSYVVFGLALPYFHGPRWREITGGRPMKVECETLYDLMGYLGETFGDRWVDGALMI